MKKVFKKFGGLENLPYLCTTFANETKRESFENGSLIYWLHKERKCSIYLSISFNGK